MPNNEIQLAAPRITVPDAFRSRDVDKDGLLSEQEFVADGGPKTSVFRRDFHVFDANGDGQMTPEEFLTIPYFASENQPIAIPDPVVLLSRKRLTDVKEHWAGWDKDGDGFLDKIEFASAKIGNRIRGLESSTLNDWDLNHDGKISPDDAAEALDIAFGVRIPSGESLRSNKGQVVDWILFRGMTADAKK